MKKSNVICSFFVVISFFLSVMVNYKGETQCANLSDLFLDDIEALADDCELPNNFTCTGDQKQYCTYTNSSTGTTIRCPGSTLKND